MLAHGAQLVDRAFRPGLGARAVVADHHGNQRMIAFAHALKFIDQAANLHVLIGKLRGGDFHGACGEGLLIGGKAVPRGNLGRTLR